MRQSERNKIYAIAFMSYLNHLAVPAVILKKRRRHSNDITAALLMIYILSKDIGISHNAFKSFYAAAGWPTEKIQEVQDILILSGLVKKTSIHGTYYLTDKGETTARGLIQQISRATHNQLHALGI